VKNRSLLLHYLGYGFVLTLLGAAAGLVLGPLTLPHLFWNSMSSFYTLPEWRPGFDIGFLVMAVILVLSSLLVSWLTCRSLLGEQPAATLKPKPPQVYKRNFLEKLVHLDRWGFNAQYNLRDATRNRLRSLMAIVGVLGCTALVICGLGMNDSMADLKDWQYARVFGFESKLVLGATADADDVTTLLDDYAGQAILEDAIEVRSDETRLTGTLTVLGEPPTSEGGTLFGITDTRLQPVELPENGLALTQKLAEQLGVVKGDAISWHRYGSREWIVGTIALINRDPSAQGITITSGQFEALGFEFTPTSVLTLEVVGSQPAGVEQVILRSESSSNWDALTEAMMTLIVVMIAAAAVLSIVVLYNLGLLSFTEAQVQIATLKVLGMKTARLRRLLLTQNLWFSALGFIMGIPCGYALIEMIAKFSGGEFDFPILFHPTMIAAAFVFTFGLSILVNLGFSRTIRRQNMVEALKAPE
jgi:putative ABC transport system permease protein